MARRFPKLDLGFLKEDDAEVRLSDAAIDPSSIEPTSSPSEPAMEAFEPVQEPKVAESAPTSSAAVPPKVEILK